VTAAPAAVHDASNPLDVATVMLGLVETQPAL
jgi:hypothetical protein